MKTSRLSFLLLSAAVSVGCFATVSFFCGLILMLSSGVRLHGDLTPAALTGLFYVALRLRKGGGFVFEWKGFLLASLASLLFYLLANFGNSFRVEWERAPVALFVSGAVFVALSARFTELIMNGMNARKMNRYFVEVVFLRAFRGLGYLFFVSMVFFPFYTLVVSSLKPQAALLAKPLDYAVDLGREGLFEGYVELFVQFNFGNYIFVSTVVSVVTVLVTVAFAIPGAYAVARLNFPGRKILSRSILLIYMVPAIVLVIPLYGIFSLLGLRDSLLGLLIVYPATTLPVAVYMLRGYFVSIPAELEEAGMVDGCSRLGVIGRITLPLCLPALASVALYVFMIAWNEFLFAFMFLDDPETFTISRGVVSLNSSEVPRQYLMAGAVIVTLPVLMLFLWFERFLIQGLASGGVKG